MLLSVDTKGSVRFLYHDELRPLLDLGVATIERASHVEPSPDGRWLADLAPVSGPVLGPFETRAEALAAEVKWIEEHVL